MARLDEIKPLPAADYLRALLSYDLQTGLLVWRVRKGSCAAGRVAGTVNANGYIVVIIDKVHYYAHRLIWKMVTGDDPQVLVDHADLDKTNNRWVNLRGAKLSENRWNSRLQKNNTSGFKGVKFCSTHKKWRVVIHVNKKALHVGYFANIELAGSARARAAADLHRQFAR